MRKPDIQDILTAKNERVRVYSQLRGDQQTAADAYEGLQDIGIEPPYSVIRTPRARNLIDVPVDHVISDNPTVKVRPRNVGQKYQEEADLLEKFLQGWILTLLPHWRMKSKYVFALGEAYDKILVDYTKLDLLEEEPDRKDEEAHALWEVKVFDNFPLIMRCPHPKTVFAHSIETNCRPYDVFEIYDRDCFEVEEKWEGSVYGFSQMHYGNTVQWTEWWHTDWRAFFTSQGEGSDMKWNVAFKDKTQPVEPNPYGFVPYRHAVAGYGMDSEKFEPHKRIKSILFPSYDIIKFENRVFSQLDTILSKFAHPIPVKTGEWDSSKIDYSPGHEIPLPEGKYWGKDFNFVNGPAPDPAIFQTLALIANFFEQVQPGVVRGQASSASSPAYAEESRTGQARLKYGAPLMALEETTAGILGDGLRLAELIVKKPLTVHGAGDTGNYLQTLKPEDINGYYLCTVDMEAKDPTLSRQKKMLGFELWKGRGISRRMFHEDYMNVSNSTELSAELDADDIMATDPNIKAAIAAEALSVMGREKALEILKQEALKNQKIDAWQAQKQQQMGGDPTLMAQNNIMQGVSTNGQQIPGQGIPRMDNPVGATPLPGNPDVPGSA